MILIIMQFEKVQRGELTDEQQAWRALENKLQVFLPEELMESFDAEVVEQMHKDFVASNTK